MQNFPEIQGVIRIFLFFSLFPFSSPARRLRRPACFTIAPTPRPVRRSRVDNDPVAVPFPLSLSFAPRSLPLSLCSPELNPSPTPSAARRRRCRRPRASPSTPSAPPSPSAPSPRRNRAPAPWTGRSTPFPAVLTSAVAVDSTAAVAPPAPSTSPLRSSPHGELPGALPSLSLRREPSLRRRPEAAAVPTARRSYFR